MSIPAISSNKSALQRFIGFVERNGNKLPHPFMIFIMLSVVVLILSFLLNQAGVSATYMSASSKAGVASKQVTVVVKNLLTPAVLKSFLADFVKTFMSFPPVGLVMIMTLGIGFVEEMGFFIALMKKTLLGVPSYMVTFILAMVGVCANIASDAGIIFAASTGAAIFAATGRNPILGGVVGYAAGHGGFTANLMVAGTDALLAGITESAARSMGIVAPTHPLINWYFMFAATFVLAICITFVTEKVMPSLLKIEARSNIAFAEGQKVTELENRGLRYAGIAAVLFLLSVLAVTVPSDGLLRNAQGQILPRSPLTESIVSLLFFFFAITGTSYGIGAKVIKTHRDIPKFMTSGLKGALSFFVIAFPAAFFIEFFKASNMATVLAVKGAAVLQYMNLQGIALAVVFVFLVSFLNMFMTSGSAKWLILAPIFVPMFSMMNFSPAMTQVAYRIGDSVTNPISPINFFIPVLIAIIEQYKKNDEPVGLGTVISLTLPYSLSFLVCLLVMMILWMLLGLPLGPGASMWLK